MDFRGNVCFTVGRYGCEDVFWRAGVSLIYGVEDILKFIYWDFIFYFGENIRSNLNWFSCGVSNCSFIISYYLVIGDCKIGKWWW